MLGLVNLLEGITLSFDVKASNVRVARAWIINKLTPFSKALLLLQ